MCVPRNTMYSSPMIGAYSLLSSKQPFFALPTLCKSSSVADTERAFIALGITSCLCSGSQILPSIKISIVLCSQNMHTIKVGAACVTPNTRWFKHMTSNRGCISPPVVSGSVTRLNVIDINISFLTVPIKHQSVFLGLWVSALTVSKPHCSCPKIVPTFAYMHASLHPSICYALIRDGTIHILYFRFDIWPTVRYIHDTFHNHAIYHTKCLMNNFKCSTMEPLISPPNQSGAILKEGWSLVRGLQHSTLGGAYND